MTKEEAIAATDRITAMLVQNNLIQVSEQLVKTKPHPYEDELDKIKKRFSTITEHRSLNDLKSRSW